MELAMTKPPKSPPPQAPRPQDDPRQQPPQQSNPRPRESNANPQPGKDERRNRSI
jgi:hypothetical protein